MAIIEALLAFLSRQLGRFLNTAFGWATTLLFGKVPQQRQLYLSAIAAGSVLWLVVVIGVAFPSVGTFLLAFVPLPEWIDKASVRFVMLALAGLIPAFVGVISLFLVDPGDRPRGFAAKAKAIVKGYPYTVGLALTLVLMLLAAPILKIRDAARGWSSTHIPVVVEASDYGEVVHQVQRLLDESGIATQRRKASWLLRWPTRVFTIFVGSEIDDLVASDLAVLHSPTLEVLLHPSDLVISGRPRETTRAHAVLTEHLTATEAYLTWTKEAHQLEDRLAALLKKIQANAILRQRAQAELEQIEATLKKLPLSYEEWEILFRERLLVERDLLARTNPAAATPPQSVSRRARPATPRAGLGVAKTVAVGLALAALVGNRRGLGPKSIANSLKTAVRRLSSRWMQRAIAGE